MKFTDSRKPNPHISKVINRLLLVGFLAVCALYCLTPIHNGNFFWHLRNGEDILDTAEIRTVDQFTWTARGRTWLQQEWLAEVTFAAAWRSLGESGPVLLKTLIIVLSVLFMILAARCRGANIPAIIVTGLLWFILSNGRWIVRPHIISILLFSLYLYLLARGTGGFLKSLAIFIPLQIIWTNAHAGFLMGYFLLGIPVIDSLLDRNWKNSLEKFGVLAAAILTSGIHPNGFRSLTYITDFLSRPLFRQSIREWWSPFHPLYQPGHRISTTAVLLVALLAATWILIIIRRKRNKIKTVYILALIALSIAALTSSRNIDMLAIAAVVWVSPLLTGIPARFSAALLACSIAVPFIFGIPREFGPAREIGTGVDWSVYPHQLADFLEKNPELLEARIFNTNEISGYLEYIFGERLPLYIDGRCHLFSEKFYAEYLLLLSAEKSNASLVIDIYNSREINLALFNWPKKEGSSAYILSASPEWCPVYWDDFTIAYARKSFIDSIDFQWHSFPHVDPLFPDLLLEIPFYQLPESWIDEILLAVSPPMNYEPAIILSSALLLRNGTLGSIDTLPFLCGNDDLERSIISALNGEEPCIHDPRLRVIQSWVHSRAGRYEEAMEAAIASEEQRVISCTAILSGESTRSEGNITVPPPMVPSGAWDRYLSGNLSQDDCRIIEASALLVCGMQEKAVDSIRTIISESGDFSPWAFSVSGAVLALSGLDSLASVLGDSAISINRNLYTLLVRGQIAEISGNLDEAVSMYEQCLQISPELYKARYHLALCQWMKGDIQDAIQDYHVLMDLNYLTPAVESLFEWGEYLSGNVNRER